MVHVHRSRRSALLKALLVLLAAAILPACGPREDVRVTVNNNGSVPVHVLVEVGDDDDDEAIVAPASSVGFEYDRVSRVKLRVWRESDGLLLFSDSFDEDDIRRQHDHISVTVTP